MIAAIAPPLRLLLDDEIITEIVQTAARGVHCMICDQPIGDYDERANVVALRQRDTGETLIRFAHLGCGESRLIDVDVLPAEQKTLEPGHPARQTQHAWTLTARGTQPAIVLVWDVAAAAHTQLRGERLLAALHIEGMRGGRDIEQIKPPRLDSLAVSRDGATLVIETPHGRELLELADPAAPAMGLHFAAKRRELVLVCGYKLALDGISLDEAERQLQYGEAVAAIVAYDDPELAAWSPRETRRRRTLRRLAGLTPTARRRSAAAREGG
jgi:hypothetical protein